MKSIILIRHAEPEAPADGSTSHWTDTNLTALGRRQAECVAERLNRDLGEVPCQLYSSDLKRAMQTAEIIGRAIGATPNPVAELREFNNGLAAGGSEEELKRVAAAMTPPARDLEANPQGETWREFHQRGL